MPNALGQWSYTKHLILSDQKHFTNTKPFCNFGQIFLQTNNLSNFSNEKSLDKFFKKKISSENDNFTYFEYH